MPEIPEDAADILAKEAIIRFCSTADAFLKAKGIRDGLAGFSLKRAPFAAEIRKTWPVAPAPVPPPDMNSLEVRMNPSFCDDGDDAGTAAPDELSPQSILAIVKDKPLRLNQIAERLGELPEKVRAAIEAPGSGLQVAAAGWVKAA